MMPGEFGDESQSDESDVSYVDDPYDEKGSGVNGRITTKKLTLIGMYHIMPKARIVTLMIIVLMNHSLSSPLQV